MKKIILEVDKCYQGNKTGNMTEGMGGGQYK